MKRKQIVVAFHGRNYTMEIRWSPAWGHGSVWIDNQKVTSWGAPLAEFRRHDFQALGFPMAVVRTDGRRAPHAVSDVGLEVNGTPVSALGLPTGLGAPLGTHSIDKNCPRCHEGALWLVASDGTVTIACATCGRFTI